MKKENGNLKHLGSISLCSCILLSKPASILCQLLLLLHPHQDLSAIKSYMSQKVCFTPRKSIKLPVKMRPESWQFLVLAYQKVPVEAEQSLPLVALPEVEKNYTHELFKEQIRPQTTRTCNLTSQVYVSTKKCTYVESGKLWNLQYLVSIIVAVLFFSLEQEFNDGDHSWLVVYAHEMKSS